MTSTKSKTICGGRGDTNLLGASWKLAHKFNNFFGESVAYY